MTEIHTWAIDEHYRISRFLNWWVAQNSNDVMAFPMDMEPGEWDEQYRMWEE